MRGTHCLKSKNLHSIERQNWEPGHQRPHFVLPFHLADAGVKETIIPTEEYGQGKPYS